MIDGISINFGSSRNFANMEKIRRKFNAIVNLSKFISNKKILNEVIVMGTTKFVTKLYTYFFHIFYHDVICITRLFEPKSRLKCFLFQLWIRTWKVEFIVFSWWLGKVLIHIIMNPMNKLNRIKYLGWISKLSFLNSNTGTNIWNYRVGAKYISQY